MSEQSKYAPVPGKIPGTVLNLGGRDLILAPLNLDGVQECTGRLNEETGETSPGLFAGFFKMKTAADVIQAGASIVHLSLVRNYPDMTVDDVLALLDMGNVNRAVLNVAGVSGMEFAKPGEIPPAAQ